MFRLIHRRHRCRPLGVVPRPSRFSDTAGEYAVLYAAEAVRCAFWEALARNRFTRRNRRELPRADVGARLVVSLRSNDALRLLDLRGDGPIRIAAPTAVAHDANHAAGRALSSATHANVPEANGFLFQSRLQDISALPYSTALSGSWKRPRSIRLWNTPTFWRRLRATKLPS